MANKWKEGWFLPVGRRVLLAAALWALRIWSLVDWPETNTKSNKNKIKYEIVKNVIKAVDH